MFPSGDARHDDEELGLNVTLPPNVSLDVGSKCGAQHNLAVLDTDP